ncbi:hypothetical protein POVCU1_007900 [Plasmodium ovale curtisi]|uniref:Uncharacterized protein n=1 Tax=Plasmodium ovale curtisi TaxID=864141 RepID=A0A1A8VS86_PLAOA|nr:hypothetical protein POVCU1_007900 [Plasmodium ovale curtisi]
MCFHDNGEKYKIKKKARDDFHANAKMDAKVDAEEGGFVKLEDAPCRYSIMSDTSLHLLYTASYVHLEFL